jgi:hypothetical protein
MCALLQKARLVNHRHATAAAEAGDHLIAHQIAQRIGIPATSTKQ